MKAMNMNEINALNVGDKVEVMLRDTSGAPAWYPAVVSAKRHQSLEDYYECGKVYIPDTVYVTVTVDGREFPNYAAHAGACRKA